MLLFLPDLPMAMGHLGRERMGVSAQEAQASHLVSIFLRTHRDLPVIGICFVSLPYSRPWLRSEKTSPMTSHAYGVYLRGENASFLHIHILYKLP